MHYFLEAIFQSVPFNYFNATHEISRLEALTRLGYLYVVSHKSNGRNVSVIYQQLTLFVAFEQYDLYVRVGIR
jgi:hypothetical protein